MHLDYDIVLPNPTKPNVVTQVVTYTVTTGGVAGSPVVVTVDLAANPVVVPQVSMLPNDEFDGTVVQVDASGNKSEPSPNFKFVAVDDQAPGVPDSLALKFTGYSA